MTTAKLQQLWNHLTCAEQSASDSATRYRIAEAKRIVNSELEKPFIVKRENEKASGAEPLA